MYSSFLIIPAIVATLTSEAHLQDRDHRLFRKCRRGDDACLAIAIEEALKILGPGNKMLNIPSINPLTVNELNICGGKSAVLVPQRYKDSELIGLNTGRVKNAHLDVEKGILSFSNVVPKLIQKGQYSVKGTVLNYTINGKGNFVAEYDNLGFTHTIEFTKETKSGETYLKVTSYDIQLATPDCILFSYENLVDGNPELSKKVNQSINDDSKEIFADLGQKFGWSIAGKLEKIASLVFGQVPLKEFYVQ